MENLQPSTFNLELPIATTSWTTWALGVEGWLLNVSTFKTILPLEANE